MIVGRGERRERERERERESARARARLPIRNYDTITTATYDTHGGHCRLAVLQ
jgi:hypothetical protein